MPCSLNKWNTRIHFSLDIPLYKVLPSHLIATSAAKWKKNKQTIKIETLQESYDKKPTE